MDGISLSQQDRQLFAKIMRTDLRGKTCVTSAMLLAGIALGIVLLICGIQRSQDALIFAGATEMMVIPIVCIARHHIIRLYRLVQTITSLAEQDGLNLTCK